MFEQFNVTCKSFYRSQYTKHSMIGKQKENCRVKCNQCKCLKSMLGSLHGISYVLCKQTIDTENIDIQSGLKTV